MKAFVIAAGMLAGQAFGQSLPARRSGVDEIVIATSAQLAPLLGRVASELQRLRPGFKVSILPVGSDVAMAELYTRQADLAIIGRTATDPEVKAFQWIYQYPPQRWALLRGSIATAGHSPSIRLLVNAANPIRQLSAQQLEMVYRRRHSLRWRDLGVNGSLGMRPVHPIMPGTEQGTGRFIRDELFGGSTLFAWERVQEIAEPMHRGTVDDRLGSRIAAAVARDPQALAFLPGNAVPGTRTVRLTCGHIEEDSHCNANGALERFIYAYSDPAPRPGVRDFLRLFANVGTGSRIYLAPYRQLPLDETRKLRNALK